MNQLADKVAIITGASSGIGRAMALALAAAGAHVALAARREPELQAVAQEIRNLGRVALVAPTDVTDQAQVSQLVARTLATFGRVDILMPSAGIYVRGRIEKLTAADFERSMAVNFQGTVNLVLAALPHLQAQRSGHVVLFSSIDGKKGVRTDAPYAASKFALAGFGDVLRQDLHGTGVGVTILFLGRVDTPFIAGRKFHWMSAPISPESVAQATLAAIRRRQAEVILPFQAHALLLANWLSPRLGDWAVRLFRLEGLEEE